MLNIYKLKSMHFNTRNNDQLLLQHPPVGTRGVSSKKLLGGPEIFFFSTMDIAPVLGDTNFPDVIQDVMHPDQLLMSF